MLHNWNEKTEGDEEMIDGLEEIPEEIQAKVKRALENEHVDDDDWKGVSGSAGCLPTTTDAFQDAEMNRFNPDKKMQGMFVKKPAKSKKKRDVSHSRRDYQCVANSMQDDDDGRNFENGPSFDEEDEYEEGYQDRPTARGKQPAQNYDQDFGDNNYYSDDEQETVKYRPGASQPERHMARGGNRGRGSGRGQQASRRESHVPKRRMIPGAYRKALPDEAD